MQHAGVVTSQQPLRSGQSYAPTDPAARAPKGGNEGRPTVAPRWLVIAAVCATLLCVVACGPTGGGDRAGGANSSGVSSSSDPALTVTLAVEPLKVGTTTVNVVVRDGAEPLTGAAAQVRGDMTHAGMAPASGDLRESAPGVYTTDDFVLAMAGDWLITVDVTAADGRKVSTESFVTVSNP